MTSAQPVVARPATALPRVTVLLATYQGRTWLPEQLTSILAQEGVELDVVVSDDGSGDGTWEWLQQLEDPRVVVLPQDGKRGASGNFYRLLAELDLTGRELVALADQDDLWLPGKLASHVAMVRAGADGVSSNVTAVWPDGRRVLLRKDFPQRSLDWVCEGPGPGCTFVLSTRLVALVQQRLTDPASPARGTDFHDWLLYGICRAAGWRWVIDPTPTVDYRQHDSNTFGANLTVASARHRLWLARERWHRRQAAEMTRVALEVSPDPRLSRLLRLLEDDSVPGRLRLAARAGQLRRRPRDRVVLAGLIAGGLW